GAELEDTRPPREGREDRGPRGGGDRDRGPRRDGGGDRGRGPRRDGGGGGGRDRDRGPRREGGDDRPRGEGRGDRGDRGPRPERSNDDGPAPEVAPALLTPDAGRRAGTRRPAADRDIRQRSGTVDVHAEARIADPGATPPSTPETSPPQRR